MLRSIVWHAVLGVVFLLMAVGCFGAMCASFLKDEPYHIAVAYLAGFYVFLDGAGDEHKKWLHARLEREFNAAVFRRSLS